MLITAFLFVVAYLEAFPVNEWHGGPHSPRSCSAMFASDATKCVNMGRRRGILMTSIILLMGGPLPSTKMANAQETSSITVPLLSTGKEYLIYYRVDGSLFRAVLDSGSPFLMIPGSCSENTKSKSGCYRNQGEPSGLASTYEGFDGFEGNMEWRLAPFSFVNATGSLMGPPQITFGVASESIMAGPGGVFFGLIRDTDDRIRPSFLGQTSVQSFEINLATTNPTLTLSTAPMISGDFILLTDVLRRQYGALVNHYTARSQSVQVNGFPLVAADGKPIFVIFDTGVTGMVVSQKLFNERYVSARERRERSLWGNVQVSFRTARGKTVDLTATKPITTSFDPKISWKRFGGHLIVLGLAFLDGNKLSVDIDKGKLWIETS
jgi:hypothetical protein